MNSKNRRKQQQEKHKKMLEHASFSYINSGAGTEAAPYNQFGSITIAFRSLPQHSKARNNAYQLGFGFCSPRENSLDFWRGREIAFGRCHAVERPSSFHLFVVSTKEILSEIDKRPQWQRKLGLETLLKIQIILLNLPFEEGKALRHFLHLPPWLFWFLWAIKHPGNTQGVPPNAFQDIPTDPDFYVKIHTPASLEPALQKISQTMKKVKVVPDFNTKEGRFQ